MMNKSIIIALFFFVASCNSNQKDSEKEESIYPENQLFYRTEYARLDYECMNNSNSVLKSEFCDQRSALMVKNKNRVDWVGIVKEVNENWNKKGSFQVYLSDDVVVLELGQVSIEKIREINEGDIIIYTGENDYGHVIVKSFSIKN